MGRIDQPVADTLVVPLMMVMLQELADGVPQLPFPEARKIETEWATFCDRLARYPS